MKPAAGRGGTHAALVSNPKKKGKASLRILRIYRRLFRAYGPQAWWPGDSPFEIIVGAILTQNTSWINVEKAIDGLKEGGLLNPRKISMISAARLADVIRPCGYHRVKARRLKAFVRFLSRDFGGSMERMFRRPLADLRARLLRVKGIGPETADSILLYAGRKPTFVIDAYTRRVLDRHQLGPADASYGELQGYFMDRLPVRTSLYNEYHALLVRVGKEHCRARRPDCEACPLRADLPEGGLRVQAPPGAGGCVSR